jgi:hypothetical protein
VKGSTPLRSTCRQIGRAAWCSGNRKLQLRSNRRRLSSHLRVEGTPRASAGRGSMGTRLRRHLHPTQPLRPTGRELPRKPTSLRSRGCVVLLHCFARGLSSRKSTGRRGAVQDAGSIPAGSTYMHARLDWRCAGESRWARRRGSSGHPAGGQLRRVRNQDPANIDPTQGGPGRSDLQV